MKIILYILSILFMVIGLFFMIVYTNLFSFGYTFFNYLEFIFTKFEVLLLFIGIFLLLYIYKKDRF